MSYIARSIPFIERLKRKYQQELEGSLDWETEVRIWYQEQYRITPFAPEYSQIPFMYMEFLYYRFFNFPISEEKRKHYIKEKIAERKIKEEKEKEKNVVVQLQGSNYTQEEIDDIMKAVTRSGGNGNS